MLSSITPNAMYIRASKKDLDTIQKYGLIKRPSSAGGGNGLFTTTAIPGNVCLGVYPGRIMHTNEFDDGVEKGKTTGVYAVAMYLLIPNAKSIAQNPTIDWGSWTIDPEGLHGQMHPDFAQSVTPYLNEPPINGKANVRWVVNYKKHTLEMWTCTNVAAGSELFICYGPEYSRKYKTSCNTKNAPSEWAIFDTKPMKVDWNNNRFDIAKIVTVNQYWKKLTPIAKQNYATFVQTQLKQWGSPSSNSNKSNAARTSPNSKGPLNMVHPNPTEANRRMEIRADKNEIAREHKYFEVKMSKVGGKGVFARQDIPQNFLVGPYPGRIMSIPAFEHAVFVAKTTTQTYPVNKPVLEPTSTTLQRKPVLGNWIIDPGNARGEVHPDFHGSVTPYLNEPPNNQKANVRWVVNYLKQRLEMWTSSAVNAGQELFICYGAKYKRSYKTSCDAEAQDEWAVFDNKGPRKVHWKSERDYRGYLRAIRTYWEGLSKANKEFHVKFVRNEKRKWKDRAASIEHVHVVHPDPAEANRVYIQGKQALAARNLEPFTFVAVAPGRVYTNSNHETLFGVNSNSTASFYGFRRGRSRRGAPGYMDPGYNWRSALNASKADPVRMNYGFIVTSLNRRTRKINTQFQHAAGGYIVAPKQKKQQPNCVIVINVPRSRVEYWTGPGAVAKGEVLTVSFEDPLKEKRWPILYVLYGGMKRPISVNELAFKGKEGVLKNLAGYNSPNNVKKLAAGYNPGEENFHAALQKVRQAKVRTQCRSVSTLSDDAVLRLTRLFVKFGKAQNDRSEDAYTKALVVFDELDKRARPGSNVGGVVGLTQIVTNMGAKERNALPPPLKVIVRDFMQVMPGNTSAHIHRLLLVRIAREILPELCTRAQRRVANTRPSKRLRVQ